MPTTSTTFARRSLADKAKAAAASIRQEVTIDLLAAFPRMHDGEDVYYVTDTSLIELAASLARTSPPMLRLTPSGRPEAGRLQGSVTLTDFGRALLAGHGDRIVTCGIDRWLGGVHLNGNGAPWRWDDTRQAIARR